MSPGQSVTYVPGPYLMQAPSSRMGLDRFNVSLCGLLNRTGCELLEEADSLF